MNDAPMSSKNRRLLLDAIRETASLLDGRIPPTPEYPEPNSYGYLFKRVKDRFGASYRDLPDSYVERVLEFVSREARKFL